MKVNLHNLRERAIDALFDSVDSKPMRFLTDNTRPICLGLALLMAAFFLGFVARQHEPGAMVFGVVFGVVFVAVAAFICWLMYRESHPGAARGEPPMPIPPAPSRHWPPPLYPGRQELTRTSDGRLVLPELPGPHPGVEIEPSPDWPHRS